MGTSVQDFHCFEGFFEEAIKRARAALKRARKKSKYGDVEEFVDEVLCPFNKLIANDSLLTKIGTDRQELDRLLQTGYESAARIFLKGVRSSNPRLYLCAVLGTGVDFYKHPTLQSFVRILFAVVVLGFLSRKLREIRLLCANKVKEYLVKANFSLSDIGTDEAEIGRLS
ncbi:MAG: hypothetical protein AAB926_01035 [Patescibacteria group bacterium]